METPGSPPLKDESAILENAVAPIEPFLSRPDGVPGREDELDDMLILDIAVAPTVSLRVRPPGVDAFEGAGLWWIGLPSVVNENALFQTGLRWFSFRVSSNLGYSIGSLGSGPTISIAHAKTVPRNGDR